MGLLSLLAIILPTAVGVTGSIIQGVRSRRTTKESMAELQENKYDMRRSIQMRADAYKRLGDIIYGIDLNREINPERNYFASSKPNDYSLTKAFGGKA